eukprot:Clim_evm17s244 gene=Clim_evmTU17s244
MSKSRGGTDGSDFQHRHRVAARYQAAAAGREKLAGMAKFFFAYPVIALAVHGAGIRNNWETSTMGVEGQAIVVFCSFFIYVLSNVMAQRNIDMPLGAFAVLSLAMFVTHIVLASAWHFVYPITPVSKKLRNIWVLDAIVNLVGAALHFHVMRANHDVFAARNTNTGSVQQKKTR